MTTRECCLKTIVQKYRMGAVRVFDKWRRLQSVGEINREKIDWCLRWMDGWMDDLRFFVLFNSISVILGQWADDKQSRCMCAMEPVYG